MALFHHDPLHSDKTLESLLEKNANEVEHDFQVFLAREKDVYEL